ncbi:phospho-acceptor domain-containing protein [Kineococcus xinjiangensis]|uniref:Sensor-like histidine kinase SenX3 n=1 Tax=Kineococcus xinjiangensis TaxID=512762 RepID=A0A2S6IWX5_9ACTN|nr:ATP-binding protein [Kineococcus xinjiangensis]PPK98833.1 phospho-acceptor domain-containing protein [Kineococcus xinjiangensis]
MAETDAMQRSSRKLAEAARLAALHEYRLLDTPADDELTAIVRVAALVAGVPYATLNLIDEQRQCQLTTAGFDGADSSREDSMCALHFADGEFVHIVDASRDPRYEANPWVDGRLAEVRFYASAPLITPAGHALGSLCVFDTEPRAISEAQIGRLQDLAQVVLALFERRRVARLNEQLALEATELQLAAEDARAEAEDARDVAQSAWSEAEARWELSEAILETIDVGVVVADPLGELIGLNRAAREWHGAGAGPDLSPAEIIGGYDLYEADGSTPLPLQRTPMYRALHGEVVTASEIVVTSADRAAMRVVCSGRALTRGNGDPLGAVVAMSDVTAARSREAALSAAHERLREREHQLNRAVQELERSNADLEQFAAIASHDLNSPLQVVAGYVELIGEVYGEQLDEQARGWVTTALNGVGRMQALITALLSYARAGASQTTREHTDVREVLDQAVLDLRTSIDACGARVVGDELPQLYCDPVLLRQLLQNLIGNAVKYRHPDRPSRVTVTAEPDPDATEQAWVLTVTDNGRGIPAGKRDEVFEMFAMVDPAARTGHGIGLATCRRIVERHGGRIWAEEGEAGGTAVRFTLPQRQGQRTS